MRRTLKFLHLLAVVTLVLAYAAGRSIQGQGELVLLEQALPGKVIERASQTKPLYSLSDRSNGQREGSIVVGTAQGWGGPFQLAIVIDGQATVRGLHVLSHKETPSFFRHLRVNGFFEQFSGKRVDEAFAPGADIDAVSSATVSSEAFAKAVRNGAHWVGTHQFGLQIEEPEEAWRFGGKELLLLGVYALVLVTLLTKFQKARLYVLGFCVLFLGFYVNRPISISNIAAVALGFVPSVREQLFWWLLVVGVLLLTLMMGKNFYCFWMCPFGGLQEFVSRIGGIKLKLSPRVAAVMKQIVYLLLWAALVIIFLTSNPAMGNFEPFAVLFSLKGLSVQWYLVTLAMVGSLCIPRFWCRFFCPVGAVLQGVAKLRSKANQVISALRTTVRSHA